MHRQDLLAKLARHEPAGDSESDALTKVTQFVQQQPSCFERSLAVGHVTGSAWLLNASRTRALLTLHRKLGMWLQPGGHADGESDVLGVALREAREESGIADVVPVSEAIFDVDVHRIPQRPGEPAHLHYDVRFLLCAPTTDRFTISEESLELQWFSPDELTTLDVDESVRRMCRKWISR